MEKKTKKRLLTEISDPAYLRKCWISLNKANKNSKGLNNETLQEFQNNLEKNISEISLQLRKKKYKFNPVRGVLLPKAEKDKFRPLRIQDIRDRLVCKAIASKLDFLLTPVFNLDNEVSFAYRKNIGVYDAINAIATHYKEGYRIILEADIIKFFDTVDRKLLLEKIFKHLPDKTLNDLIEAGLSQEVGNLSEHTVNAHYFEDSINGIPQGNSLSPLFANIYLSDFDKEMLKRKYKLVRYADDFVVLTKTGKEAKLVYDEVKDFLKTNLKLQIHELSTDADAKTKIVNPVFDKFKFLSIRFDGKNLWVDRSKVVQLKEKIKDITDEKNNFDLITLLTKTRNLLEGWLASFKFVDLERDIEEIDNYIDIQLYNILRIYGFNIKEKFLRMVKTEKGNSNQGLTTEQRKKTGVKPCLNLLESMDRNKIFP